MAILNPDALTDLNRIRDLQNPSASIPKQEENLYISLINTTSKFVHTYTHRNNLKYKSITDEYKDGLGALEVLTNFYPIITLTSIFDDTSRAFNSSSQLDYTSPPDPENDDVEIIEPHRQIIRSLNGRFGNGRSNVKITYTAGFSELIVQGGVNDQIVATDDGGQFTATITEGTYDASSLATEIETQLDASGSDDFTVTYSTVSHRYKIMSDGSVMTLDWHSSDNSRAEEFGKLIGFDTRFDNDDTSTAYYSAYPVPNVPEDLIDAVNHLVLWRYEEIKQRRIGKFSESPDTGNSFNFDYSNIPEFITDVLDAYIIRRV